MLLCATEMNKRADMDVVAEDVDGLIRREADR